MCFGCMLWICALDVWKRTKKAATVGMWGLTPYRGQANGYKSRKRVFAIISPLTCHGGSRCSPLTSLTVSEKKSLREKKVGSAEKNHACRKKSYSIVWEACPCLRLRLHLRHPRSAIPSIASISSIASIASIAHQTPLSHTKKRTFPIGIALCAHHH